MPRIERIQIPSNVIRTIPRAVVNDVPPPVVSGIKPPVVNVPSFTIDIPSYELPAPDPIVPRQSNNPTQPNPVKDDTQERPGLSPEPAVPPAVPPAIEPPKTVIEQPTINIGGIEAPLPEAAPLVTAGATAVVTTGVAVTSTIVFNKLKDSVLEPAMKRMQAQRKRKVKIKQVKPVIHYVINEDDTVDILEYSQFGTKVIDQTTDVERYIRDQVEMNSLYEHDNKVIIDDVIKDKFTKEGAKRFNSLFAPAKSIAKKLGCKFSI